MQYIMNITKQDRTLSIQEVLSLYELEKCKELEESYILINLKNDNLRLYQKLAYTNECNKVLFSAQEKDIINKINKFDWNGIYRDSFAVRIIRGMNKEDNLNKVDNLNKLDSKNELYNKELRYSKEKEFAGIIYNKLKKPKVDLENPQTMIVFFYFKERFYCCIQLWKNEKSFLERKPHLKPALHPSSLNPRLAKACINLVITKKNYMQKKALLLDPFCGVGGILIEAGLMEIFVIGIDIEPKMIKSAEENLSYYNIKNNNYLLLKDDAVRITKKKIKRVIEEKIDAIVTDLPYGKNTKKVEHYKLYLNFLKNSANLTEKMLVMFPDFFDYKNIIKKSNKWKIKYEFTYYLHKSLSKKIVLLESKKKKK